MPAVETRAADVRGALRWAESRLAGLVETPRVDAGLLLGHLLDSSRTDMFAHSQQELTCEESQRFAELVERRAGGDPLQYLTGSQAFRLLELSVGPGVLVPRPETEVVVDHALACILSVEGPVVFDIGTGSGAIALSIARERPDCKVFATEISPAALEWARRNLRKTGASNVEMIQGDLFDPLPSPLQGAVDLVVSNPPYLSDEEFASAPADVRREPRVATTSGPTGLEVISRLVQQSADWLRPGGWLVMEVSPEIPGEAARMMNERYEKVALCMDLTGRVRIAEGCRR